MEIWKDITNYEGIYQISTLGNVKGLRRVVNMPRGKTRILKDRMLNQTNCKGYLRVCLCVDGISKRFLVHRLVAESFISNPKNKPQINHLNGIKYDNRVENLEWVDNSQNMLHAYSFGLRKNKNRKKVLLFVDNIYTDYFIKSKTLEEIHSKYPIGKKLLRKILQKKLYNKEFNRFYNNIKDRQLRASILQKKTNGNTYESKKISQHTLDNKLVHKYSSIREAEKKNKY